MPVEIEPGAPPSPIEILYVVAFNELVFKIYAPAPPPPLEPELASPPPPPPPRIKYCNDEIALLEVNVAVPVVVLIL